MDIVISGLEADLDDGACPTKVERSFTWVWILALACVVQAVLHWLLHRRELYLAPNRTKLTTKSGRLTLLQINVWSGSRYSGELSPFTLFRFRNYETAQQREERYQCLLTELRTLDADVITMNESMPSPARAHRLAKDLGYDCVSRLGVAGIVFGWLRFPFISEGDAILAKPCLQLDFTGRTALTGGVMSDSFAINTCDATQAIGCTVATNVKGSVREIFIGCTHWHASVIDCPETAQCLNQLRCAAGETQKPKSIKFSFMGGKPHLFAPRLCTDE